MATDLVRFARWVRDRRRLIETIRAARRLPAGIERGTRVYVSGRLGIEGQVASITEDRAIVTVVDDSGQSHWADARDVYRIP